MVHTAWSVLHQTFQGHDHLISKVADNMGTHEESTYIAHRFISLYILYSTILSLKYSVLRQTL